MIRGLVVTAMLARGLAVGCSQQEGTPAPVTPGPASPTAVLSVQADDQNSTPSVTVAVAADASESTVAPLAVRLSGFVPLDDPMFLASHETDYFGDEELVLGVELAGEFRAYPVRMLRYHHVVNDIVGGEPLLVTY